MAKKKNIQNLGFPVGGIDRSAPYRQQPPFTTPDCLNVRPTAVIDKRGKGGTRPGLEKAVTTELGSGNPVRMLGTVNIVPSTNINTFSEGFEGATLNSLWTAASWVAAAPTIYDSFPAAFTDTGAVGATLATQSIDTTAAYEVGIYIVPWLENHNGTYSLWARMNNTTPVVTTDGLSAELTMTGTSGTFSGSLKVYNAGVLTAYAFTGGTDGVACSGWFTLEFTTSTNTAVCRWRGTQLVSQVVALGGSAQTKVGFGINATVADGVCLVDEFRLQYTSSDTAFVKRPRTTLAAVANGTLYADTTRHGQMSAITTNLTLDSTRRLACAERAQKLYIADHGNIRTTQTGCTISTATLSKGGTDFSTFSIDAHDDVCVLTAGTGATANGTYTISTVAANLTLGSSPGDGGATATIQRGPKIYDPVAGTLTLWTATTGAVPSGCPIIARYRDRLWLAGAADAPHVWYASAQSDPLDWDYAATGDGRAIYGNASDQYVVGEIITALIPHGDDRMILGCLNSIWVMRGDPAWGGQFDALSHAVGICDHGAWCVGAYGEVYCLTTTDGLYRIPPGAQGAPEPLSRPKIPAELLGANRDKYEISLLYDFKERGIHIYFTSRVSGGSSFHWFYDLNVGGFWKDSLAAAHEPFSVLAYQSEDPSFGGALLGGRNGYIRRYNPLSPTDDGTTFDSWIFYGPFRFSGNDYQEGVLGELIGTLDEDSADVTWEIYVGDSHQEAVRSTASDTGTWSTHGSGSSGKGRQYTVRPTGRGGSYTLKLSNADEAPWSMENVTVANWFGGKERML